MKLLGIFAHPDDETFCAGGTLAKYADRGAEAMVVSATRGEAGQIRDARAATRRTLGEAREQELQAACKVLGVQHAACLDYVDGTLQDQKSRLHDDLLTLFGRFRPDVVITFGDDGAYGHPDHIAISQATTAAVEQAVAGSLPAPKRLYHSHFPRSRLLLAERLSHWLVDLHERFKGTSEFAHALSLFAEESTTLRYACDFIDINWFPPGIAIIEQGEPPSGLYLVLSGEADVVREEEDGTRRHLARVGPGEFFGELGMAKGTARSADVIAVDAVTCLVLSPGAPTEFRGRGEDARFLTSSGQSGSGPRESVATTAIDVSEYVSRKIEAIAAHRSQFPINPSMFPPSMLQDMFATEYFLRVHPPIEPETELLPG
jgi:LmbE family N-acetylglucosaminyl deacetylase